MKAISSRIFFATSICLFVFGFGPLRTQAALGADFLTPATMLLFPDAEAEFNQGLAALKRQQWDSAIQYFSAAQQKAPAYPRLLLYLGLAHAKLSETKAGHEFAAIAWLNAYLLAAPDEANADEVRMQIKRLKDKAVSTILKILDGAQRSVDRLPGTIKPAENTRLAFGPWRPAAPPAPPTIEGENRDIDARKTDALRYVNDTRSLVYALLGDMDKALEAKPSKALAIWKEYAKRLESYGSIDQALAIIGKISTAEERDELRLQIVGRLKDFGDRARLEEIGTSFENRDKFIEWKFDQAIDDNNRREALRIVLHETVMDKRVADNMWAKFQEFEALRSTDVTAAGVTIQEEQAVRMSSDEDRKINVLTNLVQHQLALGNTSHARLLAKQSRQLIESRISSGKGITVSLVAALEDPALLSKLRRSSAYFGGMIYFYALTNQLDKAKDLQSAAGRELIGEELEAWRKFHMAGTYPISKAIFDRVLALIRTQGDLQKAKDLLKVMPETPCQTTVDDPSPHYKAKSLFFIARNEIERERLEDAARTISLIPASDYVHLLRPYCETAKELSLLALAKAYVRKGDVETVFAIVKQINSLVRDGVLTHDMLKELAIIQDSIKDTDNAERTRSLMRYQFLPQLIIEAREISSAAEVINLAGEIAKIYDHKSGAANVSASVRATDTIIKLADVANRLENMIWRSEQYIKFSNSTLASVWR